MPRYDEETPLLGSRRPSPLRQSVQRIDDDDIHLQFCMLAGVPPSNLPAGAPHPKIVRRSLYGRAIHRRNAQNRTYMVTASLSNTLLLSQVVLGAALTGLGASNSSHIIITVLGALNTIIAGVVAYLKSRGQPNRARMFRDDLDRVVDEIENSEIMWLGIQSGVHGYDEIAIDDSVSVRSEVARLTRLYDKVVKNNTMNDPDMYMNAVGDPASIGLRGRPAQTPATTGNDAPAPSAPTASVPDISAPAGVVVPPVATPDDPDESPASAPPKPRAPTPSEEQSKPNEAPAANGDSKPTEDLSNKPTEVDTPNGDTKKDQGPSNGNAT